MLTVIMAGGVGERFWPWSRRKRPKQLLDLTGKGSMIGLTVDRVSRLSAPEKTLIVTNVEQRDAIIREVSGRIPPENVIGEPIGQNTAPCIGLAAVVLRETYGNQPMLVLPADHLVEPIDTFKTLVTTAAKYAKEHGCLLTFGIEPTRPETGYGYIRAGKSVFKEGDAEIYEAEAFLEKPDADTAQAFVDAGNYYWNSGMFVWTTEAILEAMATHLADLHEVLNRIAIEMGTRPLTEVLNELYPQTPSVSIDYGVMEKATNVVLMKAKFEWSDVGNWELIREVHPADANGNVFVGEHIAIDSTNNTVVSPDRPVAVLGVDDVVIVDCGDTILVCRRDRAQEIKKIVKTLRKDGRDKLV